MASYGVLRYVYERMGTLNSMIQLWLDFVLKTVRLLVMISYEIMTHNAQASLVLTSLCVVFIFHLCANV